MAKRMTKNKGFLLLISLFFIGVFLYFFSRIGSWFFGISVLSFFVISLFSVYTLFFSEEVEFQVSFFYYYFILLLTSLIGLWVNSDVYLSEVRVVSYDSDAILQNILLSFVFLFFSFFSFCFLKSKFGFFRICINNNINNIALFFVNVLFFLLSCALIFVVLSLGSASSYGVDRFEYWNNIVPAWADYGRYLHIQLIVFVGIAYAESKRKIYILSFLIGMLSQFMMGEKFTGIIFGIVFFFGPFLIINKVRVSSLFSSFRFYILSGLFSFLVILFLFFSYSSIYGDFLFAFMDRVALQAQMWWSIPNLASSDFSLLKNFFGIGSTSVTDQGIYFLMEKITPQDVFERYLERGVTFTMPFPSNFLYFFGFLGSFFPLLFSAFFVALINYVFVSAIRSKDFFLLVLSVKAYYLVMRAVLMADISLFFDYKVLLVFVALFLYFLFFHFSRSISYEGD